MPSYMEDLKIVSSFKKKSKPYGRIQDRMTHGFLFKIKGTSQYFFETETVTVREGEVIFLPRGSTYSYVNTPPDDSLYMSINFQATLDSPTVRVYPLEYFHGTKYLLDSFSELLKFGTDADRYQCLSAFYEFLAYVARMEQRGDLTEGRYRVIEPGVECLKRQLYDPDLKLDRLHRLCGVSDTYFRKLFSSRFHMSPQEYVTAERLSHAKSILESGDFESIREVASQVGYRDPLYFSKAFRRFYGYPPSEICR